MSLYKVEGVMKVSLILVGFAHQIAAMPLRAFQESVRSCMMPLPRFGSKNKLRQLSTRHEVVESGGVVSELIPECRSIR